MTAKKTALYDIHIAFGAQMTEFAATLLPVRYESEREEHLAVRNAAGLFDVSHMGEFFVEGKSASSFLQFLLTNDVHSLSDGQAHYSLLLNDDGGIIDDLIVYKFNDHRFMLCVNAANIDTDWRAITARAVGIADLLVENASERFSQLALQGPKAAALLDEVVSTSLPERFFFKEMDILGIKALVARTGYTGEDGFEIFIDNSSATKLYQILMEHGRDFGLKPCGLAARDSLRLEAGLLLHGQDMDDSVLPPEAGLMFAVDLKKKDFVGKEALVALTKRGIDKKLVGYRLDERGIARHGFIVFDKDMHEIGVVTGGSWPPDQKTAIGFAYVQAACAHKGQEVLIDIRKRMTKAHLMKPRFIA